MSVPAPHFLLFAEAASVRRVDAVASAHASPTGRWRFALRTPDGEPCLEAEDDEPETSPERLQLWAIVRGLEALDEPARVTVVAAGRSISRGLRYGVAQWRENDWQWERYGQLAPVKNGDLWQRIDRAMAIHQIECHDAAVATDDLSPLEARRVSEGDPSDDLPDVRIIRHRGRRLRIDGPVRKDEGRMSNDERMPKGRRTNARPVRHWLIWIWVLIRHLNFVIGFFAALLRTSTTR